MTICSETTKRDLKNLGLTQSWLVAKINSEGGITVTPAEMSNVLNGVLITSKANRVLEKAVDLIAAEKARRAEEA